MAISFLKNKKWFLFFILFFSLPGWGKISQRKTITIPQKEVSQIVVKGSHWILNFKTAKGPYKFDLKGPLTKQILIESIEGTVEITSDIISQKQVEKNILNVTGPGVPLSLFVLKGKFHISHWTKPVFVFSQNIEIEGSANKGSWQLSLNKGKIKLNRFEGELEARGFRLNMDLKDLKGDFLFQFNEGQLKANRGEGELVYTTDKGNTILKNWKGNITGESVSGSLKGISLKPDTIQINSKKGVIAMNFSGSRPSVDAFSGEGRIRSPRYMNKKYAGKSLAVTGRLRGNGKQEGKVSLKTERGDIYIQ